jgi:hypothetical protein
MDQHHSSWPASSSPTVISLVFASLKPLCFLTGSLGQSRAVCGDPQDYVGIEQQSQNLLAFEGTKNHVGQWRVKVVGDLDFTLHKTKPDFPCRPLLDWPESRERSARFGDDDTFATRRLVDQSGKFNFGFVKIELLHRRYFLLAKI